MRRNAESWVPVVACLVFVLCLGTALAGGDEKENAEKRAKIDAMASEALQTLLAKSPTAKELSHKAIGYAVFSNLKIALGGSLGGGSGVAVPRSGKRVYMKMGTAGIGFGIGGQKYQVVFLFETEEAFRSFVDRGWQAGTSAQAAAKDKGVNVGAAFKNGVAFFQLTKKGLMASADISGTKYWKNDDLNK